MSSRDFGEYIRYFDFPCVPCGDDAAGKTDGSPHKRSPKNHFFLDREREKDARGAATWQNAVDGERRAEPGQARADKAADCADQHRLAYDQDHDGRRLKTQHFEDGHFDPALRVATLMLLDKTTTMSTTRMLTTSSMIDNSACSRLTNRATPADSVSTFNSGWLR